MRKLLIWLKWRVARKTICWQRGEPRRYKLPWGDHRKVDGRLYESR